MTPLGRLWAPWRGRYIARLGGRPARGCLFCRARRATDDHRHWVVSRGRRAFVLLNCYPYNNGHLLVAPNRHVAGVRQLQDAELLELWRLADRFLHRLDRILRPHGYNVGLNLGHAAGAGVPGHLHLHVVPRWHGDTNFMSTVAGTKVISDSLESLYRRLTS